MNRLEQNMVEAMSDTIDTLKNELSMKGQDYDALLEEVFYFFKNVKTGSDLEESIEEFEIDLSNNCGIDVSKEIEFEIAKEIGFSNSGEKK